MNNQLFEAVQIEQKTQQLFLRSRNQQLFHKKTIKEDF